MRKPDEPLGLSGLRHGGGACDSGSVSPRCSRRGASTSLDQFWNGHARVCVRHRDDGSSRLGGYLKPAPGLRGRHVEYSGLSLDQQPNSAHRHNGRIWRRFSDRHSISQRDGNGEHRGRGHSQQYPGCGPLRQFRQFGKRSYSCDYRSAGGSCAAISWTWAEKLSHEPHDYELIGHDCDKLARWNERHIHLVRPMQHKRADIGLIPGSFAATNDGNGPQLFLLNHCGERHCERERLQGRVRA